MFPPEVVGQILGLLIILVGLGLILRPVLGPLSFPSLDPGLLSSRWFHIVVTFPLAEEVVFRMLLLPYLVEGVGSVLGPTLLSVFVAWLLHAFLFVAVHLPLVPLEGRIRLVDAGLVAIVCGGAFIHLAIWPLPYHPSLEALIVVLAFHCVYNLCRLLTKPLGWLSLLVSGPIAFAAMASVYHWLFA
jgi:membrane protease YdiL (CAAX protease family)